MKKHIAVFALLNLFIFNACSQQVEENLSEQLKSLEIPQDTSLVSPFKNSGYSKYADNWVLLADGISYIEQTAPDSSFVNDSKISILKIDPSKAEFEFKSATQNEKEKLCVVDYAEKFNYNIVINAGMYDLSNQIRSKGMLINDKEHANNPNLYPSYNMMICANPKKEGIPNCQVADLTKTPYASLKNQYHSFAQGLRMIDGDGNPMAWNKRVQYCSQLIVAEDKNGMIYYIFTRSPYTHNYMINFMMNMGLKNAVYMEGGPQTSLFVDINEHRIEKLGSFVSKTFPTDANNEFWVLPNVIGIRVKN